jgi:hypothetical protein
MHHAFGGRTKTDDVNGVWELLYLAMFIQILRYEGHVTCTKNKNAHIPISKSRRNRSLGRYSYVRENFSVFFLLRWLMWSANIRELRVPQEAIHFFIRRTTASFSIKLILHGVSYGARLYYGYTAWHILLGKFRLSCSRYLRNLFFWGVMFGGGDVVSVTSRVDRLFRNVENGLPIDCHNQELDPHI